MNKSYYRRAISYAYFLDRELNKDLVHQAYINYWHTMGRDLFEEPIGRVLKCVKWAYYDMLKKKYGTNPKRKFFDYYESGKFYDPVDNRYYSLGIDSLSPDYILEGKELHDYIETVPQPRQNKIPAVLNKIVNLKYQGFKNHEIADQLAMSKALVTYYLKQVMSYINNPIRTSTVPLTKKITRKTFEDKYKHDYVFDLDRNCDHNESYQIVVHRDRDEYILVIEKEDPKIC